MDREKELEEAAEEFENSAQAPPKDKTFEDFSKESGCDKLNAASKSTDTINAVNKFNLLTAKIKGLPLVGLQEQLREIFKKEKIPGHFNILKAAFKAEEKVSKKKHEIPEKFDAIIPCSEEVNGVALVEEVATFLRTYIHMPDDLRDTIALYIGASYFLKVYDLFAFLHVTSPIKGCGKSKLLEIIAKLIPLGFIVTDPSKAALFRAVDRFQASVCFDEVDRSFKENEGLMDFCVTAYRRSDAEGFMRCTDKGDLEFFSAWGVKVVSGIGDLKFDTLRDRVIRIQLQKKTKSENVKRLRTKKLNKLSLPMRRKLMKFALTNMDQMEGVMDEGPDLPEIFEEHDRPAENWEPLVAFADLCSEEWGKRARELAVKSLGQSAEEDGSFAEELLKNMKEIFKDHPSGIYTKTLVKALNENEDWFWGGWNKGTGIKAVTVAKLLSGFGIKPDNIKVDGPRLKGYLPEWFIDAFDRYIPDPQKAGTAGTALHGSVRHENEGPYREDSKENKEIGENGTAKDQNLKIPPEEDIPLESGENIEEDVPF